MLLLPIPPTEDVPQTKYGATNSTQQLDALAQITETFNAGIWNGSSNSGNQSSSFLYWAADNWWKDLSQRDWQPRGPYEGTPLSLDVAETACLVPKDGTQCAGCRDIEEINVCDNPQNYLYWCVLASLLPLYSNTLTYIYFLVNQGCTSSYNGRSKRSFTTPPSAPPIYQCYQYRAYFPKSRTLTWLGR